MKRTHSQPTTTEDNIAAVNQELDANGSAPPSIQESQQNISESEWLQLISQLQIWDFCLSFIKESADNKKAFSQSLGNCSSLSDFIRWLGDSSDDFLMSIYQNFIENFQDSAD